MKVLMQRPVHFMKVLVQRPVRLRFWLRTIAVLIVTFIAFWMTAGFWLPALGYWLIIDDQPQASDVIAVLGSTPERAMHGIRLYQQQLGHEYWHTGDGVISRPHVFHAQDAAQLAREQGIPEADIHLLPSRSTWQDGQSIARLARERHADSIIVVTDWYHSRRAMCIIRQQLDGTGIDVSYAAPPLTDYRPDNWWQVPRHRHAVPGEYGKLVFYALRYGLQIWRC